MEIDAVTAASKARIKEIEREIDALYEAWMDRTNTTQNPLQYSQIETTNTPEDFNTRRESINKLSDDKELEVQSGIEVIEVGAPG